MARAALLASCLAVLLASACSAGKPRQQMKDLQNHMKTVTEFTCSEPQSRAVTVSAIKDVLTYESYTPPMTVVKRCDAGAGCCLQANTECRPLKTEEVLRTFRVLVKAPNSQVVSRYETVAIEQHTECSCQSIIDLPKK